VLVASPALVAYALARSDDDGAGCFISLLESAHRVDVPLPDADGPDTDASRA
jgi:hypothetical protein